MAAIAADLMIERGYKTKYNKKLKWKLLKW